jgi:hypothetical protein
MEMHQSTESETLSRMFHIVREMALTLDAEIQSKIFSAID